MNEERNRRIDFKEAGNMQNASKLALIDLYSELIWLLPDPERANCDVRIKLIWK